MVTQLSNTSPELPLTPAVSLTRLSDGTLRVTGTRVPIDRIITCYREGAEVAEISRRFPTVSSDAAAAVIDFYLQHRSAVDEYIAAREEEAENYLREIGVAEQSRALYERLAARAADTLATAAADDVVE
jgi:uncharacterized protein (DUF433 family)